MTYNKLAIAYILATALTSYTEAFAPTVSVSTRSNAAPSSLKMVATTPSDLGLSLDTSSKTNAGSMIDLDGIVFSVSL